MKTVARRLGSKPPAVVIPPPSFVYANYGGSNSPGTSTSFGKGTVIGGDFVVVCICLAGANPGTVHDDGISGTWNNIYQDNNNNGFTVAILTHVVAASGEPNNYGFQWTNPFLSTINMVSYRNIAGVEGAPGRFGAASGGNINFASIGSMGTNRIWVGFGATTNGGVLGSTPSGTNLRAVMNFSSAPYMNACDMMMPTTALSGNRTLTYTPTSNPGVGYDLILTPGLPTAPYPGMTMWLDASQITGQTDGSSLAHWYDLSGNASPADMGQVTSANQPVYYNTTSAKLINGRPAVSFNGSQMMSTAGNFSMSQPVTVQCVVKLSAVQATGGILNCGTSDFFYQVTSGWGLNMGSTAITGGTPDTNTHILTFVANLSGISLIQVDGYPVRSGNNLSGTMGNAAIWLGSAQGGGSTLQGSIAEVVLYNNVTLSTAQIAANEGYLMAKWGADNKIAPFLAIGHTLSSAPTSVSSQTVPAPTGVIAGVQLVAVMMYSNATALAASAPGWVNVFEAASGSPYNRCCAVLTRTATASEPLTYTFSQTATVSTMDLSVLAYTHGSSIDGTGISQNTTTTPTTITWPARTPTVAPDIFLAPAVCSLGDTPAIPPGFVQRAAFPGSGWNNFIFDQLLPTTAAAGPYTANFSAGFLAMAVSVLIKP